MSSTPTSGTRRRRASEFHLPSGKKIIVALPDEAVFLRNKYASAKDAEVQIEIVLHGSEEHRTYLQESLSHAESRRNALRDQHGRAFDEFVSVQSQLDAVSDQLDRLADHSSSLNASFSKFGYDAQLRTFGDDANGTATPVLSDVESGTSAMSEWEDRMSGETIKLFRRPIIKQYFHRGLLWRSSEETQIMSFELFLDLLYGRESPLFVSRTRV
jgi:chromosome segregation ATPase